MAPLVEMHKVSKRFGDLQALIDVDLEVERGEVVVVVGPSGSGKSTLCRTINRLETIDSGTILIDGQPLPEEGRPLARLRADIGMVFQSFNLFPHKTVIENVMLGPVKVRGVNKAQARERAAGLLERVGIADKAGRYPTQLSGGQQQRAAIARALAMEPKLMLLDEITSALDPELVSEVLNIVRDLARQGMTMLLATHEMGFAREVASKVCFLYEGVVHEEGPPEVLFGEPREERTRAFLKRIIEAGRL